MCKNSTCYLSIAISIITSITMAIAFYIGALPGIIFLVIASLILAALATLTIVLYKGYKDNWCLCSNGFCLSIGIAGAFLFGIPALVVTLTVGTILSTLLIALVGFFLGLTFVNLIALLLCVSKSCYIQNNC